MPITGSVPATQQVETYTAGEDIPAKSGVCIFEAKGKVYKAQATSWSRMPAIGITQAAAKIDKGVEVYQFGLVTNVSRTEEFSSDDLIFVSATAGKLTKIPVEGVGDISQEIGRAKNNSDISLNIQAAIEIGS